MKAFNKWTASAEGSGESREEENKAKNPQ